MNTETPKQDDPCCAAEAQGGIARTDATGRTEMVPELLAWTTSLEHDRSLVREDLLGSAAHVTMLRKVGLLELDDAQKLRGSLLRMFDEATAGKLVLADGEEDVHMAIESLLTRSSVRSASASTPRARATTRSRRPSASTCAIRRRGRSARSRTW